MIELARQRGRRSVTCSGWRRRSTASPCYLRCSATATATGVFCATAASQATAVALRGHGPELHEQTENQYTPSTAFERHLKKIEEPTAGLFRSALTYDPKLETSDFSINKDELNRFNDAAKLADSGFEMLFAQDEECARSDRDRLEENITQ